MKQKFNINAKDVPNLENFSYGQQLLIINNLEQSAKYDFIEQEALRMYEERMNENGITGRMIDSVRKNYLLEINKKKAQIKASEAGLTFYKDQLEKILESVETTGLPVQKDPAMKNGIRIEYAHNLENLSPEEQKIVTEFNKSATRFGEIPYEWSLDKRGVANKILSGELATISQKTRYENAKKEYETLKEQVSAIKQKSVAEARREGNGEKIKKAETEQFRFLRQIDNNVRLNQFLSAHPDAKKELQELGNDWDKVGSILFKDVVGERGVYMALGAIARKGARTLMDTTGIMAIPVAATIGGIRGWFRGGKELMEKEKQARRGMKTMGNELTMVRTDKFGKKLKDESGNKITEQFSLHDKFRDVGESKKAIILQVSQASLKD